MFTLAILIPIILVAMVAYSIPGLYLARGMYMTAAREINSRPVQVVPPMPERPRIKMDEMLHISGDRWGNSIGRCAILDNSGRACNCKYRDDWVELKNAWIDYKEWKEKYGHIKNGVLSEPKVNMTPIYWAVPLWPAVSASMFIKGGAKNIPDYRAIERMENELKEL